MAARGQKVELHVEDLEAGRGKVIPTLYVHSARVGPVNYNKFQSWYFSGLRDWKLVDDQAPPRETATERQIRMIQTHEDMMFELHGPLHKSTAAKLELERREKEAIEIELRAQQETGRAIVVKTGFSLPPEQQTARVQRLSLIHI